MKKLGTLLALLLMLLASSAWAEDEWSVTLNPAGGVWPDGTTEAVTFTVPAGTKIDFAAHTPSLEGNDLLGWYYANGQPFPGARKVTENVSLWAHWSASQVEVTYDLVLTTASGEKLTLEYENGVYQFTQVSMIYGGYAQRAGKYTLYEEELRTAMAGDDGSASRVLATAGSNYIDATGTIYAEFYNDGEFELYYDYTNAGARTKYCMETGYWTLAGYTAPLANTEIPVDETGMGYTSAHVDWDRSLLVSDADTYAAAEKEAAAQAGEDTEGQAEATAEPEKEFTVQPGVVIFTADAANSDTMKLWFYDNGLMSVYFTSFTYEMDKDYIWAFDEEGNLTITWHGEGDALNTVADGVCTMADTHDNTYSFSVADLAAAVPEKAELLTIPATNSDTMKVVLYSNHTCAELFDLSGFGQEGQFYAVSSGTWSEAEDGQLSLALDYAAVPVMVEGKALSFDLPSGNNYAVEMP